GALNLGSSSALTFMKRLLQYTAFMAALSGLETSAFAADNGARPTPAQQFKTLLAEFSQATPLRWQSPTDEELKQIAARADKVTLQLLELAETHPAEPFALEALTQV